MDNQQKQTDEQQQDAHIDVTRSQNRQQQQSAGNDSGAENRPAGTEKKETPEHVHGAHKEGAYPRQSDDPGMHPGDVHEKE